MNPVKYVAGGVVFILALTTVISSMGTIETGTKGVKYTYGVASEVINEGVYFTAPFITSVRTWDIRTQKLDVQAAGASKDLQTVAVDAAVNYSIDPAQLLAIVRDIGEGYSVKLLQPAIQESIKSATAKYTAEELITKREEVRTTILKTLIEKMQSTGIVVSGLNITNLEFSASFNAAIEAKVTAEQNALAQKNKLEQVKYEAEQKVVAAKAEAESIRIQAESISKQGGAEFVQLQAIAKWNGELPTYMMGNSTPILNLK